MLPIYNVSLKNIFEQQGCIKARKKINLLLLYLQAKKPHRISRTNIDCMSSGNGKINDGTVEKKIIIE